ncbi:hypothetical protein BKA83DRAFT_4159426 [Pisolithus microcarpus]|nr:hypothetical protein BKA83DRAFT_4159426 [Pisolithus microcarpus]
MDLPALGERLFLLSVCGEVAVSGCCRDRLIHSTYKALDSNLVSISMIYGGTLSRTVQRADDCFKLSFAISLISARISRV